MIRYTDKILYEAYNNDWTNKPDFEFYASVVASESEVIDAVIKNTWLDEAHGLYADRLGSNAIKPSFHVYRASYSGILYYVRPKE